MLRFRKSLTSKDVKLIAVAALTVGMGFYITGAFSSFGNFGFALVGALVAFLFFGAAVESELNDLHKYVEKPFYELKKMRHQDPAVRLATYFLGICVLYTISALSISIASAGASAGDREESTGLVATEDIPPQPLHKQREWQFNMFVALLAPALLGIRFALGEPDKDRK